MDRIGLISDTHIPQAAAEIPRWALEALKGSRVILHAGDVTSPMALEQLKQVGPVLTVKGNMDPHGAETGVFCLDGFAIGLVHVRPPIREVEATFGQPVDCLVYGHDHRGTVLQADELLIVSPGSPTSPAPGSSPSVAVLELRRGSLVRARLVEP